MNYIINLRKVFLYKKSDLHVYYKMIWVKSRDKHWARLRKSTVMPSGLKGNVNKGDFLCKNCYGNHIAPCLTPS